MGRHAVIAYTTAGRWAAREISFDCSSLLNRIVSSMVSQSNDLLTSSALPRRLVKWVAHSAGAEGFLVCFTAGGERKSIKI